MKVTSRALGEVLYIYLEGEIDECSVNYVRREVDESIENHAMAQKVIVNLANVSFMDSTGIGFLIGRYKKIQRYGMSMYIESPNFTADKVLAVSGIYTLIPKL
ncbi:MAG: anti-sigma factor antagonist [Clostridia bacterium]|nr:anti-sigma factor antagonist [Clostridia bacterium]MBR7100297.1 anti-sigma factor antagonist [Clostridia bacterium]